MTEIDYKLAFEELNAINRAFESHSYYTLPTLNPELFTEIRTENYQEEVVILGIRSGQHYFIRRISAEPNFTSYTYTPARHAIPVERTIINWKLV